MQSGVKSNISKILDSKSDSYESDTTLLEQTIADTSFIVMCNFPMLYNPYSTGDQYPLYSPLRFDTTLGIGNLQPQYQWIYLSKPLWDVDSLTFSSNSSVVSDFYEKSN